MSKQISSWQAPVGARTGINSSDSTPLEQAGPSDAIGQTGADSADWAPSVYGASGAPTGWGSSGGADSTAPGGSSPGGSTEVIITGGSGLIFANTYGAGVTDAFKTCIVAAERQLESLLTNSVTINVTFKESNQGNNGIALGNNWSSWTNVSYATLKSSLTSLTSDVLPASDPNSAGGKDWYLPEAYARMLGLNSSTPTTDDTVTLNSYYNWSFGQDVINGVIHELTEGGLGRVGGLGDQNSVWSTMDLFRYTSAGVADYTDGRDGKTTYFSADGGASAKGAPALSFNNQYNNATQVNTGDPADWAQTAVFGATNTGETLTLTQTELDVMAALGWDVALKQDVFTASTGDWETPGAWSLGSAPITPQDAYIGAGASARLDANVTVNSIGTDSGGILSIGDANAATLISNNGTVPNAKDVGTVLSGNHGDVIVYAGSALQIGDAFDNAGTLGVGKGSGGVGDLYLSGSVTLNGGGTVQLGEIGGAQGDILDAPGTSNDGLINVDNTIWGSGLISLDTFDNQLKGKVQAESSLQITAAAFSNEGVITAEANATLKLGQDGATHALTNTGTVGVNAGADLAISGDYTVSGYGDIGFKGAGGEITSDGAAATLTNKSTIYAYGTASATPTGQIGDQGLLASNNLTFVNSGSVIASGAGVSLTLNTGALSIDDGGGLLEAANSATLTIDSAVNTGQAASGSPPGGTIEASSGGTVVIASAISDTIVGSSVTGQVVVDGGTVDVLAGASLDVPVQFTANGGTLELTSPVGPVQVSGSGGAIDLTSAQVSVSGGGDAIVFVGGAGNVANLSDTAGVDDTVSGANGAINLTSAQVSVSGGGGNKIKFSGGVGNVVNVSGTGTVADIVSGSNGAINVSGGSRVTLTGSNDSITAGVGDKIALKSGTGDAFTGAGFSVTAAAGTSLSVGGDGLVGASDSVSGSKLDVTLLDNSHMSLSGSNDTVAVNGVSTLTLTGSNDQVTAGLGDKITLKSGTGDVFTGAGFAVTATAGASLTVGGDGLVGPTDTVTGSNISLFLQANAHASLSGSNDVVTVNGVSNLTVKGSSDTINAVSGDAITLASGTGHAVNGSGVSVYAKTASFGVDGTSDFIYVGLNDTIADLGASTLFKVKGNVGALQISGFGADATGVVDLLNHEGGYTTAAQAYAALTSDGSGGSLLSLGANGAIDFLGVAPASLGASNFKIG